LTVLPDEAVLSSIMRWPMFMPCVEKPVRTSTTLVLDASSAEFMLSVKPWPP
jgi:hypothetical protein